MIDTKRIENEFGMKVDLDADGSDRRITPYFKIVTFHFTFQK